MIRLSAYIALVLIFVAPTAHAQSPTLVGTWEGEVTQTGPGSYVGRYPAKIALDGRSGTIEYPSLSCGGEMRFIEMRGSAYAYREIINYGKDRCVQVGLVIVKPTEEGLEWEWSFDSIAKGTLRRSK